MGTGIFQANIQTLNLMEGSTAVATLPLEWINLEYLEDVEQIIPTIPDVRFWGVELGPQKEFNRKELYDEVLSHRFKCSDIRPE